MKPISCIRCGLLAFPLLQILFVTGPVKADALDTAGDFLNATIFAGDAAGSSEGNPRPDGQGWYRKNLTTPLNYYDDGQMRWATAVVRPTGSNVSYAEVKTNAVGALAFRDAYAGSLGVAWVYTNSVVGSYVLSFDNLFIGAYLRGQVVSRTNSQAEWIPLSDLWPSSTVPASSFTNTLGAGGGIALKIWNSNSMVSDAYGNVTGLNVTLRELATQHPSVWLSVSTDILEENPLLQASPVVVKVAVDELSSLDTTVTLAFGGTAVLGTDYEVSAQQVAIPAGLTHGTILLTALDNARAEGDKTITVLIDAATNAEVGEDASVTVTVADDDMPLLNKGNVLRASVFHGIEPDTADGNPNPSGQAWYRKDMTTLLKAYYPGTSTSKWATAAANTGFSYSHVTTLSPTSLFITDRWYGAVGVAWVYTNSVPGLYVLSRSSITGGYISSQYLVRPEAGADWQTLTLDNGCSTNWLARGGGLAVKLWNSNAAAASMSATVNNLKIELVDVVPRQTLIVIR